MLSRRLVRDLDEDARDVARRKMPCASSGRRHSPPVHEWPRGRRQRRRRKPQSRGQNQPYTCRIKPTAELTALAADFFNGIEPFAELIVIGEAA